MGARSSSEVLRFPDPEDTSLRAPVGRNVEPGIEELRARLASLAGECGCTMGGIFLAIAFAAAVLYFLTIGALDLASGLKAGGLVFGASVTGKLLALGVARMRMVRLRRLLAARLATPEARRVHVH